MKTQSGNAVNRRTFLRRIGATGTGLFLAGAGLSPEVMADDPKLAKIAYQLGWVKNFQFCGDYIADYKKYYQKFGLDVDLLSGGPNVNVEPVIVSGNALVGQGMPDFMASAIKNGAALTCIGASYQKNVSAIMSLAKSALLTPRDMVGKKIGLQTNNQVIWRAFLRLNKIDPASITTVPVQFDFTPLITGEVDGFFGEVIDDAVQLKEKGYDVHALLLGDFGYDMLTAIYEVASDSLKDKKKRSQIVAFMKGDILGWQDAVKDPALGAKLTAEVYGKGNGLDEQSQQASCSVANHFIVSPDTDRHGLFWMTPESVDKTIASLAAAGVKATPEMFTNEILEEIYGGKSSFQP